MSIRTILAAAVAALALPAGAVQAQTAYDINRLNQAVQICNSPIGAGTPECAKLRGQFGGGGGLGGFGGGTAGKAAGIAGLLGTAMAARGSAAPVAAAPAAPGIGIDINRAITNCVARAAGDQAQIDRCLAIANGGAKPAH